MDFQTMILQGSVVSGIENLNTPGKSSLSFLLKVRERGGLQNSFTESFFKILVFDFNLHQIVQSLQQGTTVQVIGTLESFANIKIADAYKNGAIVVAKVLQS